MDPAQKVSLGFHGHIGIEAVKATGAAPGSGIRKKRARCALMFR